MIRFRPASERGQADHGWLRTRHGFSFAEYQDPNWMGWRRLRVMNEDWIAASNGFPSHPHREMEIITVVLSGAIAHEDSMGNCGILTSTDVQTMSAGRGIVHSEANPYDQELHLYQIWIEPSKPGVTPRYDQKSFDPLDRTGRWQLLVSEDGEKESLTIVQDARIYRRQQRPSTLQNSILEGRGHWVQVISGSVLLGEVTMGPGDGAAIDEVSDYSLELLQESDLLLFDLP